MLVNKVTDQVYIGQTNDLVKRRSSHFRTLAGNRHRNNQLQNSYNKYGKEAFSMQVIEDNIICPIVVDYKEKYYINKYNSMDKKFGFNRESGGNLNKTVCEEAKKARSENMKGSKNLWFGKFGNDHPRTGHKHTEEWKKKFSQSQMGHPVKQETKDKIAAGRLGGNNPASKKVIDTKTGRIFDTLNEAALFSNMAAGNLSSRLRGIVKNNTDLKFYDK